MTAHQLRKHLADQHEIVMWGAAYDTLLRRHDVDHRFSTEVDHVHDGEGDG